MFWFDEWYKETKQESSRATNGKNLYQRSHLMTLREASELFWG